MKTQAVITREQWETKLAAAKHFMQERSKLSTAVLIEVASQHPLDEGKYPGEEFKKRLLRAKHLYQAEHAKGNTVELCIVGSRHREGDHTDSVSLSDAGIAFLEAEGIPLAALHGQDLIDRYKGALGVYNSADECFVVASYFREGSFGQLYAVVSPIQVMRKALHYIWQETLPLFYTAPTQATYHNWIQEVYETIPMVRDSDPTAQTADSEYARVSREKRLPRDR